MIFILVDIIVVVCCILFIKQFTGEKRITLNAFYFVFAREFIAFSLVGTTLFCLSQGNKYYLSYLVGNESERVRAWLVVCYCTICVFLFLSILDYVNGRRVKQLFSDMQKQLQEQTYYPNMRTWLWITVLAILAYYVYYCYRCGYIPIQKLLFASSYEMESLRHSDKFNYAGNPIVRNALFYIMPYLVSYTSYQMLNSKSNYKDLYLFIVCIAVSTLCLTSRFEKSYLIYYALGFVFIKRPSINIARQKKNKKFVLLIAIVLISFGYVAFVAGTDSYINVVYRVLYSQIMGLYVHIRQFPSSVSFLEFKHYPSAVAWLFNVEEIRSSRIVMQSVSTSANAGHMNSFFAAEAYANGGWIAVFFSPFIVALSIYITLLLFRKMKDDPLTRSGIVYFMMTIPITGGFLDFLYNSTLIEVFLIVACLKYLSKKVMLTRHKCQRIAGNAQ